MPDELTSEELISEGQTSDLSEEELASEPEITGHEEPATSYSTEFFRKSAEALARSQIWTNEKRPYQSLTPRLEASRQILTEAYRTLSQAIKGGEEISSAAEWLIDNFYIIQEQIVQVRIDFPREYQSSIPRLTTGRQRGLPRVYEIALNLVLFTDGVLDLDTLTGYVKSFQEVEVLTQGEIWAIPIMIRFVLIEQLAEKASHVLERRRIQPHVSELIDELSRQDVDEPGEKLRILTRWMTSVPDSWNKRILLVEMVSMMQAAGLLYEEEERWFDFRFKQMDLTLKEALVAEAQEQSRLQVSIQNAIASMRKVSETDWSDFGEECSAIDRMLRLDPAGVYHRMDFNTRDRYRAIVERLSRNSPLDETAVAEQVLLMAESSSGEERAPRDHVGYYLMGEGYEELARHIGYVMPWREKFRYWAEQNTVLYIGSVLIFTLILLAILWLITDAPDQAPGISVAVLLIAFFPALELSISTINRLFAIILPPRVLPEMDYKSGIPPDSRTVVVVPTLISSPDNVREQLEDLEVRALANLDEELQFGLLTDFPDADQQEVEGDREILEACREVIDELNRKHSSNYGDKFFLLHRSREWNDSEGVWMGYERKRGKLEEFNRLLCDPDADSTYVHFFGNVLETIVEQPVRFVITLDADTRLPPNSARELTQTAAHPLNRAIYNRQLDRIDRGYGIIQPRISIPPDASRKSRFSRIFSGDVGLDPYSSVVSDIYQDLKGEAIFTGKGIYDVEAFHQVMEKRLPENRILSHDLLESTYLRAGFASRIELFDDFPASYSSYSKRNHRWIRGDWQIASWLFQRIPERDGKQRNPLNLLSRWKIFDNLRRSLAPLFMLIFLVAGWFWMPGSPLLWTVAAFGILAFPIYVTLSSDVINRPPRVRWKLYFEKVRANLKINSLQAFSLLVVLPHQAAVHVDAVCRSLWRMNVSGNHLLEWNTASSVEAATPQSLADYLRMCWFSIATGLAVLTVSLLVNPFQWAVPIPFALLWIFSPVYVWYLNSPVVRKKEPYTEADKLKMRTWARHTWFFFERHVTAEYSWLPPDNVQEDPPLSPAARTSPTNIGLYLISIKSAYSFGYLTFSEFLDRVRKTLRSIEQLETWNGHLYNWYEIRLGGTLNPRYVSTVDSGNLAAGLIVIKEAVKREIEGEGVNRSWWRGLEDTVMAVEKIFSSYADDGLLPEEQFSEISSQILAMQEKLQAGHPTSVGAVIEKLRLLKRNALELAATDLKPLRNVLGDDQINHLYYWIESPLTHLESMKREIDLFKGLNDLDPSVHSLEEIADYAAGTENRNRVLSVITGWKQQADYIVTRCEQMISDMDFSVLYNRKRGLFHIGYNTETAQLDLSTYDLLASEARIASYIAIAKGDVPVEHWFRLSRRLTRIGRDEILLSWGGTMFEYLMPVLFMRSFPNTLLDHTYESVLRWQVEYGQQRGYPWGSSESAYNFLNLELHYQYRAFGVPGLGLRRGLAEEYVVAPYASLLALMIDVRKSVDNLDRIAAHNGLGIMGFYDAIDYTTSRLQKDESRKPVRTYMAHHHGMSLLSLDNVLHFWENHQLFHADPRVRACDLLLQERVPRGMPIKEPHPIDVELEPGEQKRIEYTVEHSGYSELDLTPPRLHMLSNGSYSLFVTHAGTGCSSLEDRALTAWQADPTRDPSGHFFYIRDLDSGTYWSSTHQPVKRKPDRYDTWFHNGKVVTSRVDEWIETTTEVCVSPEHPLELRRVTLTNYSDHERRLEVTSYAEIVLNRLADHNSHPAFSRLFIQTEYHDEYNAILARRRPRSSGDEESWFIHTLAGEAPENLTEPTQFETERGRFIGRGGSLADPQALSPGWRLSGSAGNVSDPIAALRREVVVGPGQRVQLMFGMGASGSRERVLELADIVDNQQAADREFDLATAYSLVEQAHLGITGVEGHYFQKLASFMLYPSQRYRAPVSKLVKNRRQQSGLWAYGISGDLPLLVFRIREMDQMRHVKTLLRAHSFWKMKGLDSDLLILNDHPPSYADELQEAIQQAIEASLKGWVGDKSGGVFLLKSDKLADEDLTLLLSVAMVVFEGEVPRILFPDDRSDEPRSFLHNIAETPYKRQPLHVEPPSAEDSVPGPSADVTDSDRAQDRVVQQPTEASESTREPQPGRESQPGRGSLPDRESQPDHESQPDRGSQPGRGSQPDEPQPYESQRLLYFNRYGGFSQEGDAYHIQLAQEDGTGLPDLPPAPWINTIANPSAGCLVSERGAGYSWSRNSRENKLTGWFNDPIVDPLSEALYIRDEDLRQFWSPLPGPAPGNGRYSVTHGFGYSRFEHQSAELQQTTTFFMAAEDPVKITRTEIRNLSDRPRRLSLYSFLEPVMGVDRITSSRYIIPTLCDDDQTITAVNRYNNEFAGRTLFHRMVVPGAEVRERHYSTDRTRFIGRNGSLADPAALRYDESLDNRIRVGGDLCSVFQAVVELQPGEQITMLTLLGETEQREQALQLADRFSEPGRVNDELERVMREWREKLTTLQVKTPDSSLDLMVNGWLMYQNLASRLYARSAFYQAGGAYGFRDQLQDVMAALYVDPGMTRQQILLHASRQFPEGDVQHWWHPPTGRGIRSRITDDRLWLPYVTTFYIDATADRAILDEQIPYITARDLEEGEHEAYLEPEESDQTGSLYDHCCRAIDISLKTGRHGLPLIGAGDWNDGMNRVGEGGEGESVWLGFFLYDILENFRHICDARGDSERGERYREFAERLRNRLNENGWDGEWYLRAFFDDGTPLGSVENEECQIDAISQAWSVISGVADADRRAKALRALEERLISVDDRIIRLLTPPFDQLERDPGYIRGYIPGVRENGGQYSHGALWVVRAFAEAGLGDKAVQYLNMINPVNHARTPEEVEIYKVEPYVIAADVYGELPLTGKGGWTWYTGSGGWMYRVAVESILGITFRDGHTLRIQPVIASDWPGYSVRIRSHQNTVYEIRVDNPDGLETGALEGTVDGEKIPASGGGAQIRLKQDGEVHKVRLVLRKRASGGAS